MDEQKNGGVSYIGDRILRLSGGKDYSHQVKEAVPAYTGRERMTQVSHYELDAKLEVIETRMDARLQRVEGLFESIQKEQHETRQAVKMSMWNAWFAMLAGVAIVVAVVAILMDTINSASSDVNNWTRDAIQEMRADRRATDQTILEIKQLLDQRQSTDKQTQNPQ